MRPSESWNWMTRAPRPPGMWMTLPTDAGIQWTSTASCGICTGDLSTVVDEVASVSSLGASWADDGGGVASGSEKTSPVAGGFAPLHLRPRLFLL